MTVKSSANFGSTPKRVISFPKLMFSGNERLIVLFYEHGIGTVVDPGTSGLVLGIPKDSWNMQMFIDYHPNNSITLRNQYND